MLSTKFIRIFNLTYPNLQARYKFVHTYIYKMDKAYMRCPEGSDVFELSFQYFNQELNINRQFNFSRKLSESVNTFLARVNTNISKVLDKKQKKRKNADETPTNDSSKQVQLTQNGEQVNSDLLCEDLFKMGGDIRLKLVDQEYTVVINTPWVKNIVLPTSMLANFPVYPAKFETLFLNKNLSQFTWYKSLDKANWNVAGTGFLYTPSKSDIDCFLKLDCIPRNETDVGPVTETISTGKVEADPGQCPFDIRHGFTRDKLGGKKVVTYNILADLYCDSDYSRTVLFPYCPPYALSIDYRKQLVLKELIGYNADVICLQEVDEKVFDNDISPVLGTLGLEGIFHKKGGTLREGLACFYNASRFRLVKSLCVILGEALENNPLFTDLWSTISKNENLTKRLSERGTSLQVTVLESIENNEILLVANTHLYFHPDADHIRLLQAGISNIYIEETIRQFKETEKDKQISVIYCGDFNSVPDCGIYKLFTTGHVPDNFVDWSSNTEEAVTGLSLTNNRLLTSACGTPKYTNFTEGFKDCLDYIFYETDRFEVNQVVPLPSLEELTAHTAIPSVLAPSDHVALIADLSWL